MKSKYSPGKDISEAQYITEIICEKKAKKDKTNLPVRFWQLKAWEKFYKYQIVLAHQLLKNYSFADVIRALNDPKCKNAFSFRAPHLIKQIQFYSKQPKPEFKEPFVPAQKTEKFGEVKKKKKNNLLNRLDAFDDGETS